MMPRDPRRGKSCGFRRYHWRSIGLTCREKYPFVYIWCVSFSLVEPFIMQFSTLRRGSGRVWRVGEGGDDMLPTTGTIDTIDRAASQVTPEEVRARRLAVIGDLYGRAVRHRDRAVTEQDTTAPHLNLFAELGIARRELQHSNVLRLLLDPRGTHGQGNLFLRAFLDRLAQDRPALRDLSAAHDHAWRVRREVFCGVGRGFADLVLNNPKLGLWIVVENKIDADDQDAQLARYWQWLQTQGKPTDDRILCYLTIDGRAPSAGALEDLPGRRVLRLSHKCDIAPLLRRIRDRVAAPEVRMIVDHYHEIVRSL